MNFENGKVLGGIGALLMFIGCIVSFIDSLCFGVIEIIGVVFVLVSLYNLANYYKEKGIFANALFGGLAAIIGVVVSYILFFVAVLPSLTDFMYTLFPEWNGDMASITNLTPDVANLDISALMPFINGVLLICVVLCIFALIAAFFVRRSLKELSKRSGENLFATVSLLLFIGILLAILLVGLLFIWISTLLLAIAFFKLKPPEPILPPTTDAPLPTPI